MASLYKQVQDLWRDFERTNVLDEDERGHPSLEPFSEAFLFCVMSNTLSPHQKTQSISRNIAKVALSLHGHASVLQSYIGNQHAKALSQSGIEGQRADGNISKSSDCPDVPQVDPKAFSSIWAVRVL